MQFGKQLCLVLVPQYRTHPTTSTIPTTKIKLKVPKRLWSCRYCMAVRIVDSGPGRGRTLPIWLSVHRKNYVPWHVVVVSSDTILAWKHRRMWGYVRDHSIFHRSWLVVVRLHRNRGRNCIDDDGNESAFLSPSQAPTTLLRVPLSTDLAAQGLDIVDVTHIMHMDLPGTVHRLGRTGRLNWSRHVKEFVLQRIMNRLQVNITCFGRSTTTSTTWDLFLRLHNTSHCLSRTIFKSTLKGICVCFIIYHL